jgi:hypothetical protein
MKKLKLHEYISENQERISEMIRLNIIPSIRPIYERNIYNEFLEMDEKIPLMKRYDRLAKNHSLSLTTIRVIISKMKEEVEVM